MFLIRSCSKAAPSRAGATGRPGTAVTTAPLLMPPPRKTARGGLYKQIVPLLIPPPRNTARGGLYKQIVPLLMPPPRKTARGGLYKQIVREQIGLLVLIGECDPSLMHGDTRLLAEIAKTTPVTKKVMVYITMTYIVMAYIIMTYIVMALSL